MDNNLQRFKSDLANLTQQGQDMYIDHIGRHGDQTRFTKELKEAIKTIKFPFEETYQSWYSEALALINQLIPSRSEEFQFLYKGDGKRRIVNKFTFNIQDWLLGTHSPKSVTFGTRDYPDWEVVHGKLKAQNEILNSAIRRFESSLFDIKQVATADLFDSELDEARELLKNGFTRAAGAIAGVVIERHLSQVCEKHSLKIPNKNPSIADYNEFLKQNLVYEIPTWRNIQLLADIRNLCDHKKDRDPKPDEVTDLIEGADKIIKTIF